MSDRRGQSAVLGSVLLVALGVALAGTVLVYGGSLAGGVSEPATPSLEATQSSGASPYESSAALRISHGGGPEISPDEIAVLVDGERVRNQSDLSLSYSASTFGVGERLVVEQSDAAGFSGAEEVLLVRDTGDSAFRLRTFTIDGGGPGAGPSVFGFEASTVGERPAEPWQTDQSGSPSSTIEIREYTPGDRSLFLSTSSNGAGDRSSATATLDVNLSRVAEIRIDYAHQNDAWITVDDGTNRSTTDDGELASNTDEWRTVSIDADVFSGGAELTLGNREQTNSPGGSGSAEVYFDDIRFYDADGDRIAAEDVLL